MDVRRRDQGLEFYDAHSYPRLELDQEIDVAFRTHFTARRGAEQRKLLDAVATAQFG